MKNSAAQQASDATPELPWRPISELDPSDDEHWFLRSDSRGWVVDGPRATQNHGGDDEDGWQWFAPCLHPPIAARELTAAQGVGESELDWRLGWAQAYSGANLYSDDGELQDNAMRPYIDWKWDSAACIAMKIGQRAEKKAATLSQPIEPQGAVVVTDAMVDRAAAAWVQAWGDRNGPSYENMMLSDKTKIASHARAALEAALPVAVGAGEDEIEAVIACLGDDAAGLLSDNPDDERAHNMLRAAELLGAMTPATPAGKGGAS